MHGDLVSRANQCGRSSAAATEALHGCLTTVRVLMARALWSLCQLLLTSYDVNSLRSATIGRNNASDTLSISRVQLVDIYASQPKSTLLVAKLLAEGIPELQSISLTRTTNRDGDIG